MCDSESKPHTRLDNVRALVSAILFAIVVVSFGVSVISYFFSDRSDSTGKYLVTVVYVQNYEGMRALRANEISATKLYLIDGPSGLMLGEIYDTYKDPIDPIAMETYLNELLGFEVSEPGYWWADWPGVPLSRLEFWLISQNRQLISGIFVVNPEDLR